VCSAIFHVSLSFAAWSIHSRRRGSTFKSRFRFCARALASIAALDFRTVSSCSTHSHVRGSYQILAAVFLCSPSRFTRLIFSQSYFSLINLYPSHRRTWAARRVVGSDAARARRAVGRMLVFSFFFLPKICCNECITLLMEKLYLCYFSFSILVLASLCINYIHNLYT